MNNYHFLLCFKLKIEGEDFLKTGSPTSFLELTAFLNSYAEHRPKSPVQLGVDIIVDFPSFVKAGSLRSRNKDIFYLIATPKGINFVCYPYDVNHWNTICASVDKGEFHLFPWSELQLAIRQDAIRVENSGCCGGEAIATAAFIRG